MDFLEIISGRFLFNAVGATVRWIYGTIWRTLLRKKKYTFREYLYGPKNSDDWFDFTGHNFVNRVVGMAFVVLVAWLIIKLE